MHDVTRFNELSHIPLATRVGSYHAEALYWGILGKKWWRNYWHTHSFFEVCYVFEGQGSFRLQSKKYALKRGDLFIARPGQPHEIVAAARQPLGIYFWAYTLTKQDEGAGADAAQIDRLLEDFAASGRAVMGKQPAIHRTLQLMTEEIGNRSPGYVQALSALMMKLVLDTARAATPAQRMPQPSGRRSSADAVADTAIHYLRDNLSRQFEVRDVAAQVNLSERQLNRIFHQITGKSVLAYLTALRMERASQLLLEQELPIKQISAAVGYPDTRYFTTLFGQRVGVTPGEFRRNGGTRFLKGRRHTE